MKNILLLTILLFASKLTIAQKELVTIDEHDKFIFYQVVDKPELTVDTMHRRVLTGLKNKKDFKPEAGEERSIIVKSKMMLYNNLSVVKHEEGELTYTLHVEFKDNKYRFWLTDFKLSPYARNRFGVYTRVPNGEVPLEELRKKKDTRPLDNYLDQIARFGKQTGEEMEKMLLAPEKKAKEPAKTDTRKW